MFLFESVAIKCAVIDITQIWGQRYRHSACLLPVIWSNKSGENVLKTHRWILCSVKMSIECDTTEQASHRSPTQINHTTIAFQLNSLNISALHDITNRTNSVDGHNLNFMAFFLRSIRTRLTKLLMKFVKPININLFLEH